MRRMSWTLRSFTSCFKKGLHVKKGKLRTFCEVPGLPTAYPFGTQQQDHVRICDELRACTEALEISFQML